MMRLSLLLLFISLHADYVKWYFNYDKAHQIALKEDKMLMVLLVNNYPKESNKVIKTTFINQAYISKLDKNFISVIVKKGQKQSYPIEMLYTVVYPALFFLDKDELFIGESIFGDITPKSFQNHLNNLNI